jgi:DHA1 family tetracycline resistance protein-like MFS transporter
VGDPAAQSAVRAGRAPALPFILVSVFIDVVGIGIAIPVLPMLVGELTATREAQTYWYGVLIVTYGLMQFACSPMLGALSDRYGRRPVLLASIVGLGLHFLLLGLAPTLWLMLAARVLGGITGASFSVASAYASDVSTPDQRARSFGLIGAAFGLGFIFGPMLGGVLGAVNLRLPFYVAAGLALVNAAYGFFLVPESLPPERRAPFSWQRSNPLTALRVLAQHREIGGLVAVFGLVVFAQILLQSTWVLSTHFRFGWGPWENGISLCCVGIVAAVTQGGLLGRLLRHFGEVRLAFLGLASGFFAYVLYGIAPQGWMMYAIIFANFAAFAAGPAMQAIISKAVDPREQGVTMGALNSINSVMFVIAPLVGTPVLAQVSHLPPGDLRTGLTFFLCAAVQALAWMLARKHFSGRVAAQAA